jgi:TolB-like protein
MRVNVVVGAVVVTASLACASGGASRRSTAAAADSTARTALAAERALGADAAARTIAVLPLAVRSADTTLAPLGYAIADLFATDLARSRHLAVVERARLSEVTRELDLGASGVVDSATVPRAGRLLGAQRLVVGSVVDRGRGEFGVEVRIASSTDGRVERALSARAPLREILAAERALALRVYEALGVTLTPAERETVERAPAPTLSALLAYGAGVRDESRGDVASAALHYDDAARLDAAFARAREARARLGGVASRGGARAAITARNRAVARLGATTVANGALNASPVSTLGAGVDAMMMTGMATMMMEMMAASDPMSGTSAATAQAQGALQGRAVAGQAQAAFATVVVRLRTVP